MRFGYDIELEDYEVICMTCLDKDIESLEISNHKQYKSFSCIYHNEFEMKGLDEFVNLIHVSFNRNCISVIENIGHLKHLQELSLSGNRIKKIRGLDGLVCLRGVDLYGNEIEKIEGLNGLVNLRSIRLCLNRISDMKGLEYIGSNKIEDLMLNDNYITEIQNIEYLPNLKHLHLNGNKITKITDESLNHINKNRITVAIDEEYNIVRELNAYNKSEIIQE